MAKQRKPSLERQRHARWILARRRDVDERGGRRDAGALFHVETLLVDGDRHDTRARHRQRREQVGEARVLDPDAVRALEQYARHEIDGLHRTVEDHDLFRVAVDAAHCCEMPRRRLAQRLVAERREIAEESGSADTPTARGKPFKERERERVECRQSGEKRFRARNARRCIRTRRAAAPRGDAGKRLAAERAGPPMLHSRARRHARLRGDERPVADATDEQALGLQLRHRIVDGVARDAPVLRELPRRRQPRARGQAPIDDCRKTRLVDLVSQAQSLRALSGQEGDHRALRAFRHVASILETSRGVSRRPQQWPIILRHIGPCDRATWRAVSANST